MSSVALKIYFTRLVILSRQKQLLTTYLQKSVEVYL